MVGFDKDNIIDVDYMDADKEDFKSRVINGEPLFYSVKQVSEMVGVEPSCIRFWGKRFENLLDIEVSNRNRQFRKTDIEKLKIIKKLTKEDGLSLKQVEEYVSSKGFDIDDIGKSVIDASNPLAIQTFITAVTMEMDKKLDLFAETLLSRIEGRENVNFTMQQDLNEKVQENIAITVDDIVSEKLEGALGNFKTYVDTKEQEKLSRDTEILNTMKQGMDERKNLEYLIQQIQAQNRSKPLWKRILNK